MLSKTLEYYHGNQSECRENDFALETYEYQKSPVHTVPACCHIIFKT